MEDFKQVRLQIDDGRNPRTFPMARLAEYLTDFASLVGSKEDVHLIEVEDGSTMPCAWFPAAKERQIHERIRQAKSQVASSEANQAYRKLNEKLEADKGLGAILDTARAKIIDFPGHTRHKEEILGPFKEPATIDGEIERVGGKDETVPVWVKRNDGTVLHCETTKAIAKELGKLLYEPIRVIGTATRMRGDDGFWYLNKFTIKKYETLSPDGLLSVIARLRAIDGQWSHTSYDDVKRLRNYEVENE